MKEELLRPYRAGDNVLCKGYNIVGKIILVDGERLHVSSILDDVPLPHRTFAPDEVEFIPPAKTKDSPNG
jgi:hypothetical protein